MMETTYITDLYRGAAVDAEFEEDLVCPLKNLFHLGPDGQLHLRRTCIWCRHNTTLLLTRDASAASEATGSA